MRNDEQQTMPGPHVRMREAPVIPDSPSGVDARYATGSRMQVIEAHIVGGDGICPAGWHSHDYEQITCVIEGHIRANVGSEQFCAGPGDVIVVPGGVDHRIEFVGDVYLVEAVCPPRQMESES